MDEKTFSNVCENDVYDLIKSYNNNNPATIRVTGYKKVNSNSKLTLSGKLLIKIVKNQNGKNTLFVTVKDATKHPLSNEYGIAFVDDYGVNFLTDTFYQIISIETIPNYKIDDFISLGVKSKTNINKIKNLLNDNYDDLSLFKIVSMYVTKPTLLNWVLLIINNYKFSDLYKFVYIFNFIKNHHSLVSLLDKELTSYKTDTDIDKLILNIKKLIKNEDILKLVKKFNTLQRKVLVGNILSGKMPDKEIAILYELKSMKPQIINNVIKKISPINNYKDIIDQLEICTKSDYNWDFDDFIKFTLNKENNGLNYDITYKNKDKGIIVIKVNDYKTMLTIGRRTSWCISRCESSWNDYVVDDWLYSTNQYVLFNFSIKSADKSRDCMIAFTTNFDGSIIVNAHNFFNNNILSQDNNFLPANDPPFYINEKLDYYGLTLSQIIGEPITPFFDWNLKSFIEFANKNGISNISFDDNKNICLIPFSMKGSDVVFDILFKNHTFIPVYRSIRFNNEGLFCTLLLDFNKNFNDSLFAQLIKFKKSFYGYDIIYQSTDFNGCVCFNDVFSILYDSKINGTIIKLSVENSLDLIWYYYNNSCFDKVIDIISNCDKPFDNFSSILISNNTIADIISRVLKTDNIKLIKKVINDDSFITLTKNINAEINIHLLLSNVVYNVQLLHDIISNDNMIYVLNVIFKFKEKYINNNSILFIKYEFLNNIIDLSLLYDEVGQYAIKYYSEHKWYDAKLEIYSDDENKNVTVNFFNFLILKHSFKNALKLINLEKELNIEVTGANNYSYELLNQFCKNKYFNKISDFLDVYKYVIEKLNIYS